MVGLSVVFVTYAPRINFKKVELNDSNESTFCKSGID